MNADIEVGAALGFTLGDVEKSVGNILERNREPKPIRRPLRAVSEVVGAGTATQLTICRVTAAGAVPQGRIWDLRWIWIGDQTLATAAHPGVVFIGDASQAQYQLAGQPDTGKVSDAVMSFGSCPFSANFSRFTYEIQAGEDLYVGVFGVEVGNMVVVNAAVDEYDSRALLASRI